MLTILLVIAGLGAAAWLLLRGDGRTHLVSDSGPCRDEIVAMAPGESAHCSRSDAFMEVHRQDVGVFVVCRCPRDGGAP